MEDPPLTTQLERLIKTGGLPNNVQASTALLLGRLQSVINVRLMGPGRAQKTGLIAAFAGMELPDIPHAEVWLHYGEVPLTTVHYHDGTSQIWTPDTEHGAAHPIRIDLAAPIRELELLSFHLVGDLDRGEGERLKGSHAFQDADIVLWCTLRFDPSEAAQWNSAPDRLKDHSFLVSFTGDGSLPPSQQAALAASVEQEFYAAQQVNLNEPGQKSAKRLLSDIYNIAQSGRRADQDGAAMLLKTYETLLKVTAGSVETPEVSVEPTSPVYAKALKVISDCAIDLSDPLPNEDRSDLAGVLMKCADASQTIADLFEDVAEEDAKFRTLRDDVLTASDQLTLMTMEKGVQPAIDAVTTLIQLKRDFEMRCAA